MGTFEPNGVIGEYRVRSVVRSGIGGAVYRAEQPSLGRTIALLAPGGADPSSGAWTQFAEDARLLAALDHPALLPVYEVGRTDGRPFAAVRDVGERRLDDLIREGPLDPRVAVSIGEQIAGALERLDAADVTPAILTRSVIVVEEDGGPRVYVSPLEAIVDAPPETPVLLRDANPASRRSDAALADLLVTMVAGSESGDASRDRIPEPLRSVVDSVLSSDALGGSPSELMRAAREAVGPTRAARARRRRRAPIVAVAVVALAAAALAAVLIVRDDGGSSGSANDPVARLLATIPLNATPGSLAVTADTVWVATNEGTVLRVDPQRDEVVGTPIRFMPPREEENVTIRAGEGAIWVLDGSGGNLTRIDPGAARVSGRLRLGGILHGATVADGSVWITRSPPGAGVRQRAELIRVDTARFRRVGQPIPLGPLPLDIEVADGVAWTMNVGNGTITRVDLGTRAVRHVKPSTQPIDAALHDGTLWVPDPVDQTVTPLTVSRLSRPTEVIRAEHPYSVSATAEAVWFLADTGNESGVARLYRIDPATSTLVGRPIELGPNVGWLSAGPDIVWARSGARRALLKLAPTEPAPGPRADTLRVEEGALPSGPVPDGKLQASGFAVPFGFSVADRGWIAQAPTREAVFLARFTDPQTTLGVYAPRQFFTTAGGVRRIGTVDDLVGALTRHPHLRVVKRERVRLAGVPAVRLTVSVRPYSPYPDLCPAPCVLLLPLDDGLTVTAESNVNQRLTVASIHSRPVVVIETERQARRGFAATEPILRTLELQAPGN